jgi:hypothetical protein
VTGREDLRRVLVVVALAAALRPTSLVDVRWPNGVEYESCAPVFM